MTTMTITFFLWQLITIASGPLPQADVLSSYDDLLSDYVSAEGVVDYKNLQDRKNELQRIVYEMGKVDVQSMPDANAKKAFYINLYNAATLKLIIQHYPLKSIMDLDDGKTWDVKRVKLGDKMLSLNDIEHEILRKQFPDARIHFAVNCAAKSCPPLLNGAYFSRNLDAQLDRQTTKFVNDASQNSLVGTTIKVSKIFDWYKEDFQPGLVDFLNKYSELDIAADVEIDFKEYDWSLNGK